MTVARFPRLGAAVIGAMLLTGCATSPRPGALPYPPTPAPIAENIPKPPVSAEPLVWQPGYWDWTGTAYAWQGGAWVPRGSHGTLWQDGFWSQVGANWVWVPGHWV